MKIFNKKTNHKSIEDKFLTTASGKKITASDPMYYIHLQIHQYKKYLNLKILLLIAISALSIITLIVCFLVDKDILSILPICILAISIFLIIKNTVNLNFFKKEIKLFSKNNSNNFSKNKILPRFLKTIYLSIKKRYITTHIFSLSIIILTITYSILYNIFHKYNTHLSNIIFEYVIFIDCMVVLVAVIILYPIYTIHLLKLKSEIELVFNNGRELAIWNHRKSIINRFKEQKEHQKLRLRVEESDSDYKYEYKDKKFIVGDGDPYSEE